MKKRVLIIAIAFLAIVLSLSILIFLNFIYSKNCQSSECFNSALYKCKKAAYISDSENSAWQYEIIGKKDDKCEVDAKLLQLKNGTTELLVLEGKSMQCFLPLNTREIPGKNLNLCHGVLKEEIQGIFIKRLNSLVKNIGEINEGLDLA